MEVIRWRKNNDGSGTSVGDIGRVGIQQDFLRAVMEKCLKTINLTTVPKFAQILMENVSTDIPLGTIVWFGQKALGMNMENLTFHGMPGNLNGAAWSRSYENYQSYVLPDGEGMVELVNAHFNPYKEDVELSDLHIMSVNRDGSLSCSSGTVRDSKAAVPPVIPSRAPEEPDGDSEITDVGEVDDTTPEPSPGTEGETGGEEPENDGSEDGSGIPPEFRPTPGPEGTETDGETEGETDAETGAEDQPAPTPTPTPTPTPMPTPTPTTGVEISPEFLQSMPSAA